MKDSQAKDRQAERQRTDRQRDKGQTCRDNDRQVWYLIVSIPDLCTLTYYAESQRTQALS